MKKSISNIILPTASALILALAAGGIAAAERNVQSGYGVRVTGSSGNCVKSEGGVLDLCFDDADGDGVLDNKDKCPGTPKGAKVDADGCMPKLVLNNINFGVDSSSLNTSAHAILNPIIEAVKGRPDVKGLIVTGHTDDTASEKHNQKLSEARAQSVANYLQAGGVAVPVSAKGMGESSPIADNKTDAGRAQNRRVEIEASK